MSACGKKDASFSLRALLALCSLLCLTLPSQAHLLDQLLQGTLVSVGTDVVTLEIKLIPGIDVAVTVISGIDSNRDGTISKVESLVFVRSVLRAMELSLDGRNLEIEYLGHVLPPLAELRAGIGAVRIKARAGLGNVANGEHRFICRNLQLSPVRIYLLNALVPETPRITIHSQKRDELQTTLQLDYTLRAAEPVILNEPE